VNDPSDDLIAQRIDCYNVSMLRRNLSTKSHQSLITFYKCKYKHALYSQCESYPVELIMSKNYARTRRIIINK